MEQKIIREKLLRLIENEGIKSTHICKLTGISESHLSRFKNGTRELYKQQLEKLQQYLLSKQQ